MTMPGGTSPADDIITSFEQLPSPEKAKVAVAIRESRALPDPPPSYVGPIWIMVVAAFIILLLAGTFLLYLLVRDEISTEVVAPLVTGALGVLAGLLAPSPVTSGGGPT